MKVKKAIYIISLMPHKFPQDEMTKAEALKLWHFIDRSGRITISRLMLKRQLAKECGVFLEQLDAILGQSSLVEGLIIESSESTSKGITLDEVSSCLTTTKENDNDWVIGFCHSINSDEAEFIWRWAFNERWRAIRNRMKKWVLVRLGIESSTLSTERLIEALYNGETIEGIQKMDEKCRLKPWPNITSRIPEAWWYVPDASGLRLACPSINGSIVRKRDGSIDEILKPPKEVADYTWMWQSPPSSGVWDYAEGKHSDIGWGEALTMLEHFPRSAILIKEYDTYHILTGGTIKLIAQAIRIRKVRKDGFIMDIGFLDGDEIIDMYQMELGEDLPFELQTQLRTRNVTFRYGYEWKDIPSGLIISVMLVWRPDKHWHLQFDSVRSDLGVSDVDLISDYYALVGEDE